MKFSIVLVGLLAVFGTTYADLIGTQFELDAIEYKQRIFEDVINKTINGVFGLLGRFDPIQVKEINRNYIFHKIEIRELFVGGFSKVYAPHILLHGLLKWTFEISIHAPGVTHEIGSYKVTGPLFFGDGNVLVSVDDINLGLNASINLAGPPAIQVSFKHSIGDVEVVVAGVYNDDKLSGEITSLIKDGLTGQIQNWKEFLNRLTIIGEKILHHIINGSF